MVTLECSLATKHKFVKIEALLISFLSLQALNPSMQVKFEERENEVIGVRKVGVCDKKYMSRLFPIKE